ncbi:glycosyltransferase family 92 protein F13G3.3-like [Neocloeon triangulifer]|uniref:glycosyltransferase family 92 protein F13G3.3-like n=1 Tax=Neocloeon triangulifer TaxID=2078957 RepID=UPI00286F4F45|nr:glycosyltransferase family 92 protein F13G3.3-like [Neocloeon triangulifer]
MNYSACFILCPVKNSSRMPTGVSVYSDNMIGPFLKSKSFNNLPKAGNHMRIHRIEERKMGSQEIAACVKPLHYNYSKVWELIEWIEMNKILGIEHFYLYIHDIAPNTSCVLNEYSNQGTATLLDWNNLPLKSQVDVRTENMFAALNDCLYRAMYKHKYLAFFDLDEYLVPKQKENLTGLLSRLEQRVTDSVSFIFRNAFFYLQWPDDGNYHGLDLVTQKKTMRRNHFQERMERSKFICKPELTVEVGNHWLWEMTHKTLKQSFLKTEVALLHHYRKCEAEGDGCVSYKSEVDKYMWLYRDQLEGKMLLAQEIIGKKCGLEPIKRIK